MYQKRETNGTQLVTHSRESDLTIMKVIYGIILKNIHLPSEHIGDCASGKARLGGLDHIQNALV